VSYMKEKVGPETMEKLGECACIKAISASQWKGGIVAS
jgi:hypothetical protein